MQSAANTLKPKRENIKYYFVGLGIEKFQRGFTETKNMKQSKRVKISQLKKSEVKNKVYTLPRTLAMALVLNAHTHTHPKRREKLSFRIYL